MNCSYLIRELHDEIKKEQLNSPRNNYEKFVRVSVEDNLLLSPTAIVMEDEEVQEDCEMVSDGENTVDGGSHTAFDLATALADGDPLVQSFAEFPEIDLNKLPSAFLTKVPAPVLKALYHCSSVQGIEQLIETYSVPRHIAVVMSYADREFPPSVMEWSFAHKLHKAVLQALFYAKTPLEHAILGSQYTIIPEDVLEVTEVEEDVANVTRVMHRKGMTAKDVRIAEAEEKHCDTEHLKRVRKESASKYNATGKLKFRKLALNCDRLLKRKERDVSSDDESQAPQMDAVFPLFKSALSAKRKVKVKSKNPRRSSKSSATATAVASSSRNQHTLRTEETDDDATTDGIEEEKQTAPKCDDDELVFSDDEKQAFSPKPKKKQMPAMKSSPSRSLPSNRQDVLSPLLSPLDEAETSAAKKNKSAVDTDDATLDNDSSEKFNRTKKKETNSPLATNLEKSSTVTSISAGKTHSLASVLKPIASASASSSAQKPQPVVDLPGDDDEDDDLKDSDFEDELELDASSSSKKRKKSAPSSSKSRSSTGKAATNSSGIAFSPPKKFQLSKETREANLIERRRLQELKTYDYFPSEGGMVINEKRPADDPPITMFNHFVDCLKPHQVNTLVSLLRLLVDDSRIMKVEGVKFLWENVMKSVTAAGQKSKEVCNHYQPFVGRVPDCCFVLDIRLHYCALHGSRQDLHCHFLHCYFVDEPGHSQDQRSLSY